jgi:hypothetical protein
MQEFQNYCYAGYQNSTIQVRCAAKPSLELYSLIEDCRDMNWQPTIRSLMNLSDNLQSFSIFEPNNPAPVFEIKRLNSCTWTKREAKLAKFDQCEGCKYYSGDRHLHCAVHPNVPDPSFPMCPDFQES